VVEQVSSGRYQVRQDVFNTLRLLLASVALFLLGKSRPMRLCHPLGNASLCLDGAGVGACIRAPLHRPSERTDLQCRWHAHPSPASSGQLDMSTGADMGQCSGPKWRSHRWRPSAPSECCRKALDRGGNAGGSHRPFRSCAAMAWCPNPLHQRRRLRARRRGLP